METPAPIAQTAETATAASAHETADISPADTPGAQSAPNQSAEQPDSGHIITTESVQTAEQPASAVDKPMASEADSPVRSIKTEEQDIAKDFFESPEPDGTEVEKAVEEPPADTEEQPEMPTLSDEILDKEELELDLEQTDEPEVLEEDEIEDDPDTENEPETAEELTDGSEGQETDFISEAFDDSQEEPVMFTPEDLTPLADISFEITPDELEKVISADDETIEASLTELLEPLEPEAAETIPELIGRMVEITVKQEETAEMPEDKREELEQICRQLLETMGLPSNEELVLKFIESILLEDIDLLALRNNFEDEDIGTHERKLMNYLIVRNLSLLAGVQEPAHKLLGRYALGASLFGNSLQSLTA